MEKLRDQAKDPLIGCTLPGGHVVMDLIDVGGMGRVYRAEQQMLGRTVAVKIIHPHLLGDATVEARFITEARAASQLNHPNSVGVIDFGKFEGRLYMVMEYIRGRDLATVAHEEGPLTIERIIDVLTQALAALEEAHHIGIIHRDLKPENIILSPLRSGGDFVKVLDFGLAKVLEAAQKRITDPGMVCGTPEYMAPEQARGDELDQRVDLYACGVLLYELLAGQLPFDGETPREVVLMHISKAPPDIRANAPHRDFPPSLVDIVSKALSKRPDDRFQNASEFADALRSVLSTDLSPHTPDTQTLKRCQRCDSMVPALQKFCGECGARLYKPIATAPILKPTSKPSSGAPRFPSPFVGRHHELRWLRERRDEASGSVVSALIAGAPGVGRTRLLARFAEQLEDADDLVIRVRPDPWWAQPGYYVLRELIRELGEVPEANNASWPGITPEARAGMMTIFGHGKATEKGAGNGRPWLSAMANSDASEQRELVAEALRWALARAHDRTSGIVVLIVDDLHAIDGASRHALRDILADPPLVPGLIVAAHDSSFEAAWDGCEAMTLHGMPEDVARSLMGEEADLLDEVADGRATLVPLYIEQLLRFATEGGRQPPTGLADLVAMRIERLRADSRRTLQAIAVLGDISTAKHLVGMIPDVSELSRCLAELNTAGMVLIEHGEAAISHPFIREVIVASTPRAVRVELHASARRDFGAEAPQMPVEAQALHAYHSDDSFEALMLLEQCAQGAHRRDDHASAVKLWHLALDLARREVARGELDDPLGAVLMFSAKLGDALALAGHPTDAQGVLSEALNLAPPTAAERPRLLASLANAERLAGRADAAYNHLEEALRIAEAHHRRDLVDSLEDIRSRWVAGL